MKEFITYDLKSKLNRSDIYNKALTALPDFNWRKGDSDSQGEYVSGMNQNKVDIQLWLEGNLVEMSVSFRGCWENNENRESKKQKLINIVEFNLIPAIGANIKKSEFI